MSKAALIISTLCLCFIAAAGALLLQTPLLTGLRHGVAGPWTADDQRALAAKLKSAGLTLPAIREYERYAQAAPLDRQAYGSLCYTVGKMYMDAGDYEKALAWLYRVEIANPQTRLTTEVGSAVIACLERTGKYSAAEHALSRRAARDAHPARTEGTVVAEISGEKVYREDITEAIDRMPEWMRAQCEGKQKRLECAKKYIADELLYRKALKLGYDKDPELLKKKKDIEKELLVARLIEHDVKDNLKIDEHDIKTYYDAHRAEYAQRESVKVSLIKAGMKEIAERIIRDLRAGKDFHQLARDHSLDKATAAGGGRFPDWVRRGENDLGIGSVDALDDALFGKKPGDITRPVSAGDAWYVFRIEETRPGRMPSYDEIKERVKNDYALYKLQARYQALLDQTLKSADVKLYLEKIGGDENK